MRPRPCLAFGWVVAAVWLGKPSTALATDLTFAFGKNLNVWSWNGMLAVNRQLGEKWTASSTASFDRKVSDSPNYTSRSTMLQGDIRSAYVIHPKLTLSISGAADRSRAESGSRVSEVETSQLLSSALYTPMMGVALRQSVGHAYDKRRNVGDGGTAYGGGLTLRPFQARLGRYGLAVVGDYSYNGVASRQGDVAKDLSLTVSYSSSDWLTQDVRYTQSENDQKYVSLLPTNPIQRRNVSGQTVQSTTSASVPLFGSFQTVAGYTDNRVEDDASDDPNDLKYRTNNTTRGWNVATTWKLPFSKPNLQTTFALGRTRRTAEPIRSVIDTLTFLPNELDRRTSDIALSMSVFYPLWERDSVVVSGTLALNRDHTPAQTELNDRDDYRRSFVAAYWHTFHYGTVCELRMERTETHNVWMNRERSAGNKWDRVLNFWAIARLDKQGFSFIQRGYFRTALEEFDYDFLTPLSPRSRNTRIGRLEWETKIPVGNQGAITTVYSIEARTLGSLLSAGPGKRPNIWRLSRNELTHIVSTTLTSQLGPSWKFEPSLAYDRQQAYIPTQARWNPFKLGKPLETQDGLHVEAGISFAPPHGIFSRRDAVTAKLIKTYRRRAGLTDTMSYISFIYRLQP